MPSRIPGWARAKQVWKIVASATLFTFLGVGGLFSTFLVIPIIAVLPGGSEGRRRRAMGFIHHAFRLFVRGLEGSGILEVVAEGLPSMEASRGALIVANHPSYLDIVVILALLPEAVCVVKNEVWRNPFFGPLVRMAGFVPIHDASATLEAAEKAIRKGLPLVVFPEGTRTRKGQPLRFQRGAARLAHRTGSPVHPLVIQVDPPLLEKGDKWYNVPVCTCRFTVRAETFVPPQCVVSEPACETLWARQWTESLETFYRGQLHAL